MGLLSDPQLALAFLDLGTTGTTDENNLFGHIRTDDGEIGFKAADYLRSLGKFRAFGHRCGVLQMARFYCRAVGRNDALDARRSLRFPQNSAPRPRAEALACAQVATWRRTSQP